MVQQFLDNSQTLGVVNSFCCGPVRGNCRQKDNNDTDCAPLLKKRKLMLEDNNYINEVCIHNNYYYDFMQIAREVIRLYVFLSPLLQITCELYH